MAATLISAPDLQWGVDEDEAGLVIESFVRTHNISKKEVKSKQGEDIGVAYYNQKEEIQVTGLLKSSGALATLALAAEATLANKVNGRGVSGGKIILESATETEAIEDFVKADLRFMRYPLIAAT